MAVRSGERAPRRPSAPRPGPRAASRQFLRPRAIVVGSGSAEIVVALGGWMFDHVTAGWDVTVLTAQPADVRPLRILGAHAADLGVALRTPPVGLHPRLVAVSAELYRSDAGVRRRLRTATRDGLRHACVWESHTTGPPQERCPLGLDTHPTPYRPSAAGRAFKAYALASASLADVGDTGTEILRGLDAARM